MGEPPDGEVPIWVAEPPGTHWICKHRRSGRSRTGLWYPGRPLEGGVGRLRMQRVARPLHVPGELYGAPFCGALDVDDVMMIRLDDLSPVVGDEEQVVVRAPAERQVDEQDGDDLSEFTSVEPDGPAP